jgi:outer membrane protein assembly factor BamD
MRQPSDRYGRTTALLITGVVFLFVLNGCSLVDYGIEAIGKIFGAGEEEDRRPAELMMEGNENLEKGRFQAASEAFQQVKDRYPYSRYAIMAELKMADALFQQKEYLAAYEAYDEFEKLHPKNNLIPYVIFQKGDCHFRQITTIDRDQSNTFQAKEEFERLIKRYPISEYAKRARRAVRKCLIFLSEYELYVGHYYYKKGKYRAAMGRYSYIIKHYPDMGQYNEAMEYISRCKRKLAEEQEELEEDLEADLEAEQETEPKELKQDETEEQPTKKPGKET